MALIEAEQYPYAVPESTYVAAAAEEFMWQHNGLGGTLDRALLALDLADRLHLSAEQTKTPERYPDLSQLQPRTQVDIIKWLALNRLWYYGSNVATDRDLSLPIPGDIREQEFAAREQVFDDIDEYSHLSRGYEQQTYDDLVSSFHMARLVVNNPMETHAAQYSVDKVALNQVLAVHRVIKALQFSGFSKTRRSILEERVRKIDAIVPLGRNHTRLIPLQIQPSPRGIEVQNWLRTLLIHIPHDVKNQNPFVMTDEDRLILATGVRVRAARLRALNPVVEIRAVE